MEARLAAGPPFQCRQECLKRLGDVLDAACRREGRQEPPSSAGLFLVGGVEQLAIRALNADRPEDFAADVPGITVLIVRTYGLA